jgi:rubrerythrin
MNKSNTLDILKKAFLLEQQGKNLYETAMDQASAEEVKAFFQELAQDELEHMAIIEKQLKAIIKTGAFISGDNQTKNTDATSSDILDTALIDKINAASFESTAITAAVSFEEKAVKLYAKRAEESNDPEEKKLYNWLSAWERTHLKKLVAVQEALMEKVWNDNNFWPL